MTSLKRKANNDKTKITKLQKKEDSSDSDLFGSDDSESEISSQESPKVQKDNKDKAREKELQQRRAQHNKTVEEAHKQNKSLGIRGKIRVSKLPHYRAKKSEGSKLWPLIEGHKNINVCSGAQGIFKELSPMYVGPIEFSGDVGTGGKRVIVKNIENLWQFSKVWDGEIDENGEPTKEFFDRRKKGWSQLKGQRWVKKGNGPNKNVPLFSYWKGKHLTYKEARREIYCPEYAKHVVKTKAYKELVKMLEDGYNINILGYDGYDYEKEGKTLEECFEDTSRPFGHEHVLACLLSNNRVWESKDKEQENNNNNQKEDSVSEEKPKRRPFKEGQDLKNQVKKVDDKKEEEE